MTAPTRRAALTALAGVPALALPAVAIAASLGADAALFALQPEIDAADQREAAALAAQTFSEETYYAARRPGLANECDAAEERTGAAQDAVDAIGRQIAAIRATTLAGLVFKAQYAVGRAQ